MNILNYIFAPTPGTAFNFYIPFAIVIAALIVKAVIFSRMYASKRKSDIAFRRLFKKTSGRLGLFAALFTFLMLVRYEQIPYFSMRLWLFIAVLWFAYFSYKTIRTYLQDYPREQLNYAKKAHEEPKEKVKSYSTKKKRK